MVQLQVVKLVTDQLGITVELFDSNGIATRFEVFCPKKVPELFEWASARKLGDTVELAVPWSGLPAESAP